MTARVAPASVEVSVRSGRVEVRSAPVAAPTVLRGNAHIDADGVLHCRPSKTVVVACPPGTDLMIGTKSGSVTCTGEFGAVVVSGHSSRIRIGACQSADVRTMSGSVTVGPVAGQCRVSTLSGRVEIVGAHRCDVTTQSGRVVVGAVQDCTVHSASGRAIVACTSPGEIDVHTISGSIDVRYPGTFAPTVFASQSKGRVDDRLDVNAPRQGSARVASTSGSVTLRNG